MGLEIFRPVVPDLNIAIVMFFTMSICYGQSLVMINWDNQNIFHGNCPLWATLETIPESLRKPREDFDNDQEFDEGSKNERAIRSDWRKDVIVSFNHPNHCDFYHQITLCSCIFGTTGFTLFAMCGRGGHDTRIFIAPWRIVIPACVFNFAFMILTLVVTHDVEYGFAKFRRDLYKLAIESMDYHKIYTGRSECEIMQYYLQPYNFKNYNICRFYIPLQINSWLMAFSWTAGFITILIRIINISDFSLLRVMVYEAPATSPLQLPSKRGHENEESLNMSEPSRKRIRRLLSPKGKDD
ncbi:uncharacterized protein LOC105695892 [Orussus abietinus]|uniref:uncharacterized protein LOC105695892 n=1 Tax=Orussus abietinus TaxID=222816 RepID=UPI000C715B3C|nr:uncharacterized protein LOC105695892 [Orussus abietinus]